MTQRINLRTLREIKANSYSSRDKWESTHVPLMTEHCMWRFWTSDDRAKANNNEQQQQQQEAQPSDAINRIIFNLRSGGGTGSADLFGDDRGLFTDSSTSRLSTPAEAGMDQLKQEFQDIGMLTQYIGQPSLTTPNRPSSQTTSQEASTVDIEMKKIKELFLEKTDKLDKMQSHWDALNRAVARDKLPAKLRIQTKPIVADSDDSKFQQKWKDCIRRAERNMVRILTDHLMDHIQLTCYQIKENTEKTFVILRTRGNLNVADTNKAMKEALDQAEKDRQARNQLR